MFSKQCDRLIETRNRFSIPYYVLKVSIARVKLFKTFAQNQAL